ncbi:aromatase/cyclase [Streptomyces cavernicola]|uniref:SRPBCC family protein n=1 Tax=Streptomyces cavernicola TaxID=3043613 RepID=A0ABT6SMK8_9ACTN|nr:SRPBCC family protein [Streptomyces sp. B-S-A6]MDI3409426.1 SRPBCC family protein [Streptomyces sp. B-S-A6]
MPRERVRRLSQAIEVDAPAGVVYTLIASAERRPLYFASNVYVERLDWYDVRGPSERLRVWALADGEVRSWTSDRVQDSARRTLSFRHDRNTEPAASTGGTASVQPLGPDRCRLTVEHALTFPDDSLEGAACLERNITATTRADLKNLRFLAERWDRLDELLLSFEESVRIEGPAERVHSFLYDVESWFKHLPHVRGVHLTEPQTGVQKVTMALDADGGTEQDITSVRLCFPHAGRIVHKETKPRKLLAAHCGEWSIVSDENGATVTSQHHVVLREQDVEQVLGPGAGLGDARRHVRAELGDETVRALHLAQEHAESAGRAA